MKNFIKRITGISVALVLLCVCAVAQDEKSTKSVTDETYGVIVSNRYVSLYPGQEAFVSFTVEPGYKNPLLFHYNGSIEISDTFIAGEFFYAEILILNSGGGLIRIVTDPIVDELKNDIIYVNAVIDNSNQRTFPLPGVSIIIECEPNIKQ